MSPKQSSHSPGRQPAVGQVNGDIPLTEADNIHLVDSEGQNLGVVRMQMAREKAEKAGLDLVVVALEEDLPICRLMNYGRHQFARKKAMHGNKRKVHRTDIKEVKMRLDTRDMGYDVKMKQVRRFLDSGDKAKVVIRFRGREVVYKHRGVDLLQKLYADIQDLGKIESGQTQPGDAFPVNSEGRTMSIVFQPLAKSRQVKRENTKVASETVAAAVSQAQDIISQGKKPQEVKMRLAPNQAPSSPDINAAVTLATRHLSAGDVVKLVVRQRSSEGGKGQQIAESVMDDLKKQLRELGAVFDPKGQGVKDKESEAADGRTLQCLLAPLAQPEDDEQTL